MWGAAWLSDTFLEPARKYRAKSITKVSIVSTPTYRCLQWFSFFRAATMCSSPLHLQNQQTLAYFSGGWIAWLRDLILGCMCAIYLGIHGDLRKHGDKFLRRCCSLIVSFVWCLIIFPAVIFKNSAFSWMFFASKFVKSLSILLTDIYHWHRVIVVIAFLLYLSQSFPVWCCM